MFSRFRHVFGVLFFLLVASCSGGGCSSGCSGCGGTTPLPGGFRKDKTIDNAASVRLSRPGLDFLEQSLPALVTKVANAPGGVMGIDIPNIDPAEAAIGSFLGVTAYLDANVCPDGPDANASPPRCHAKVGIGSAKFQIDSVKPSAIKIKATVPLQLDDTPIAAKVTYGFSGNMLLHVGYGDGSCSNGQPQLLPHPLPIDVTIPLVEETTAPRTGYMKIDVNAAVIDLSGLVEKDVHVCASCGFITDVCTGITDSSLVKGFVLDPIKTTLEGQIKTMLADQLCVAPSPALNPPCPTNTSPDAENKHCVFDSDKTKCASIPLGADSHVDLGGLLMSISPGTSGGVDFLLAGGGAMKPLPGVDANAQGRTPNGVTVGMLGGVVPQPPSKCVPQATLQLPTGIPVPDELAPTAPDAPTAPHVSIALAGRFLDYALGSFYNSGLFCLGVSSEQVAQLRAGLLSILIPSIKSLTFEQSDAAAAIATRPQAPPTIKLGGGTNATSDALLQITLPKFAMDFYLWHLDRFVRVFTFEADLLVPINLQAGKDPTTNPNGGLVPSIGDLRVSNASVTNAELLTDDPAMVANALTGLLGGIGKQLGGALSPIDLSGALATYGLGLEIGKIGKLTKGSDDFLAVFASLSKPAGAATVEADTRARLVSKHVPVDHMQLATMDRARLPELVIDVGSPLEGGPHALEYAWRIDGGARSAWSPETHVVIKDEQLLLQGRHVLRVAARVAGRAETEDATPAEIPFTIDALAPFVDIQRQGEHAVVRAWDLVSAPEALVGRYRLDDAEPGAWRPIADLARLDVGASRALDVEIKDEEGNVRTVHQELRGRADASLAAGGASCQCSTPGAASRTTSTSGALAAALGLIGVAAVALRRRTARAVGARAGRWAAMPSASRRAALALVSITAVAATSQGCGCGSEDSVGSGCGADCNQECRPEQPHGLPGSYTSIAKAPDGTIWVAGYNDAMLSEGDSQLWGDLVVGKYDAGKQGVDWQTVDGLPPRPEGTCADRPASSWRGGESDSGDDVGLWTSMQLTADGRPMVSYYDATNKRLKLAVLASPGGAWKTMTLKEEPGADIGRYSKMVLVGGKPVIAFLQVEPGSGGLTRSKVIVARANVAVPEQPGNFVFEEAAVEEANPCSATTCTGAAACLKDTGVCTATTTGCTPADCGSGKACVTQSGKATCVAVKAATQTYPDVFGDYISLAQGGGRLGMVVYDRPHGNLVALFEQSDGRWNSAIVDGETGSRIGKTAIDTGDVGVAASLAIDNVGTWHVTYVSGLDETLRYVTITGGKPGRPEIIDDGSAVDGKPFADGKHVVGDDSAVRVSGETIVVYYQDATVGTLRRAAGTPNGGAHKWDLRAIPQPNRFAGFFPQIVPDEDRVANFWEQTDQATHSRVGDVTILSP